MRRSEMKLKCMDCEQTRNKIIKNKMHVKGGCSIGKQVNRLCTQQKGLNLNTQATPHELIKPGNR
jgi:hypothetical protein